MYVGLLVHTFLSLFGFFIIIFCPLLIFLFRNRVPLGVLSRWNESRFSYISALISKECDSLTDRLVPLFIHDPDSKQEVLQIRLSKTPTHTLALKSSFYFLHIKVFMILDYKWWKWSPWWCVSAWFDCTACHPASCARLDEASPRGDLVLSLSALCPLLSQVSSVPQNVQRVNVFTFYRYLYMQNPGPELKLFTTREKSRCPAFFILCSSCCISGPHVSWPHKNVTWPFGKQKRLPRKDGEARRSNVGDGSVISWTCGLFSLLIPRPRVSISAVQAKTLQLLDARC